MHISEGVDRYRTVRTIDEYIEERPKPYFANLPRRTFGYPVGSVPSSRATRRPSFRGVTTSFSRLNVVWKALAAAVGFIGVVLSILGSLQALGWLDDLQRLVTR